MNARANRRRKARARKRLAAWRAADRDERLRRAFARMYRNIHKRLDEAFLYEVRMYAPMRWERPIVPLWVLP